MIYHGFRTSTTPGVAIPISATPRKASFVTVYPRTGNATEVRLGGNPALAENGGPGAAIPSGSGMPLNPGDSGVAWPMMAACPIDLMTIYFDPDTSGDGVQFIYGRP